MKMLVFLFPLYLFALNSCHHYENVYQALEARGFNGKPVLFCQLRIGETVKGIREDPQNLLEILKRSKIDGKVSPIPIYTIYLENGSSWPWEKITIIPINWVMDLLNIWATEWLFSIAQIYRTFAKKRLSEALPLFINSGLTRRCSQRRPVLFPCVKMISFPKLLATLTLGRRG